MKVVINRCFGGYSLSDKAIKYLGKEPRDDSWNMNYEYDDDRSNPKLIECIETLGSEEASGACAELEIVEIPDDIEYVIEDYDGMESIHEKHRVWE